MVTPQEQYQDPRIPDLFLWIVVIFIVHLGIKNSVSSPPPFLLFSFPFLIILAMERVIIVGAGW